MERQVHGGALGGGRLSLDAETGYRRIMGYKDLWIL